MRSLTPKRHHLIFCVGLALLAGGCKHHAKSQPTAPARKAVGSTTSPMGAHADFGPDRGLASTPPPYEPEAAETRSGHPPADFSSDSAYSELLAPTRQRRRRPGLGTEYGERRTSEVFTTRFVRDTERPDVVLSMHYNDNEGLRALARHSNASFGLRSRVASANATFVLNVVDERGQTLSGAQVGNRRYALGASGQRYQIGIENHSANRYEVVASVDGLDVINGSEAGFGNRGYIVNAFSSITIDGWRTSDHDVAAFRFSPMDESYAGRRGKPRNIGVIGAAFFREEGAPPRPDIHQRHRADPFPRRYAPPPP